MTALPAPRLLLGDCLERMAELPDDSVDLVLTDIPYGEVNRNSGGLRSLDKGVADVVDFKIADVVFELLRICTGSVYVFCGIGQVSEIRGLMVERGLTTRACAWRKTNPSPMNGQHVWLSGIELCVYAKYPGATFTEHCKTPVWECPTVRGIAHPTAKPLPLMTRLVAASSMPGDTVLDPFLGSGTTGVACRNLGRAFIGIERDEGYMAIAERRIAGEGETAALPFDVVEVA